MGLSPKLLDLAIVLAYMAAMVSVGLRFSRRQTSTETYFVARPSIPSWAMGLSLVATLITSVTFVAYPGSMIGAVGHVVLFVPGYLGSLFFPGERLALSEMTFWKCLRTRGAGGP